MNKINQGLAGPYLVTILFQINLNLNYILKTVSTELKIKFDKLKLLKRNFYRRCRTPGNN